MKSPFLRFAGVMALLAVSGYVAFSALPLFTGRTETAVLYYDTVRDSFPVYGVFLRQELVLPASCGFVSANELQRIPAGDFFPESGIFTAHLDGFEHLMRPELNVSAIHSLCQDRRIPVSASGKLVSDSTSEFYAIAECSKAQLIEAGQVCTLETEYFTGIELTLLEKGPPEGDFIALHFAAHRNMDTVIYLRQLSGEILLGTYEGLRVPDSAVFQGGDGLYLNRLSLGRAEKTPVRLICQGDGFKLISSPLLYEGSEVLINDTEAFLS